MPKTPRPSAPRFFFLEPERLFPERLFLEPLFFLEPLCFLEPDDLTQQEGFPLLRRFPPTINEDIIL